MLKRGIVLWMQASAWAGFWQREGSLGGRDPERRDSSRNHTCSKPGLLIQHDLLPAVSLVLGYTLELQLLFGTWLTPSEHHFVSLVLPGKEGQRWCWNLAASVLSVLAPWAGLLVGLGAPERSILSSQSASLIVWKVAEEEDEALCAWSWSASEGVLMLLESVIWMTWVKLCTNVTAGIPFCER